MKSYLSVPLCLLALSSALAESTVAPGNGFAYGANYGWIDFAAGAEVGEEKVTGSIYGANIGWIDLAAGPGVSHDGMGNLGGFAYGANIGWINFGWAGLGDNNRPRIDLLTGQFQGFAYSANLGWIDLGTGLLETREIHIVDSDNDRISDVWERNYFGTLNRVSATSDHDGDGASDYAEFIAGTVPTDKGDRLEILSTAYNGSYTEAVVQFKTSPGRLYRLESCEDLAGGWADCGLGIFRPESGGTTTKTVRWDSASRKFLRAVALLPLQPDNS